MQWPTGGKMACAATWGLNPSIVCRMINSSKSAARRKYQFLHVFEPTLALVCQLCCQPLHWLEHPSSKHVASLLCNVVNAVPACAFTDKLRRDKTRKDSRGLNVSTSLKIHFCLNLLHRSHETIYSRWCNGLRCWPCNHNISWSSPLSSLISCQLSAACHLIKT